LGRDLWWVSQNVSNTYWIGYYDTGRQWKINCCAAFRAEQQWLR
jgi:hypothetical protein